jgi:hypothetical protein
MLPALRSDLERLAPPSTEIEPPGLRARHLRRGLLGLLVAGRGVGQRRYHYVTHITTRQTTLLIATEPAICAGAAVSSFSESARPRMTFVVARVVARAEELVGRLRLERRQFPPRVRRERPRHHRRSPLPLRLVLRLDRGNPPATRHQLIGRASSPANKRANPSSAPSQIRCHRSALVTTAPPQTTQPAVPGQSVRPLPSPPATPHSASTTTSSDSRYDSLAHPQEAESATPPAKQHC